MGRPKGSRNKRTLLKEAEEHVGAKYVDQVLDSLYVLEKAMQHFFIRAEMGKTAGRKQSEVDADYEKAAHLASLVAPHRHARLSAMKLAGDPNAKWEIGDDAPIEELKRLVELHLMNLAPVLDLQILPLNGDDDLDEPEPGDEIADCDAPQGRAGNDAGAPQGLRPRDHRGGGVGYRRD
jgi:hypothetical protein